MTWPTFCLWFFAPTTTWLTIRYAVALVREITEESS